MNNLKKRVREQSRKGSKARCFSGRAIGPFMNLKAHFEGGYGIITALWIRVDPKTPEACPLAKVTIKSVTKGKTPVFNTVDANAVYVIPGDDLNPVALGIFNGQSPLFDDLENDKGKRKSRPITVLGQGVIKEDDIVTISEEEIEEEISGLSDKGPKNNTVVEPETVEPTKKKKKPVVTDEEEEEEKPKGKSNIGGKPIVTDEEEEEIGGKPIVTDEEEEEHVPEPNKKVLPTIEIKPVVYDAYVGLEISGSAEEMEEIGEILNREHSMLGVQRFIYRNRYASINIYNKKDLKAMLNFVVNTENFQLTSISAIAIKDILSSSFTKEGSAFNVETAPISRMKSFMLKDHTMAGKGSDGRTLLKIYPLISHGRLDFVVDLKTNPRFSRVIVHTIPGMSHGVKKFVKNKDNGFYIAVLNNKQQVKQLALRIDKAKLFKISTPGKQFARDLNALKTHVGSDM